MFRFQYAVKFAAKTSDLSYKTMKRGNVSGYEGLSFKFVQASQRKLK